MAMSAVAVTLQGFAYGEHVDGLPPRSLGYRLLTPVSPEAWCAEVEALARGLQTAPYPDHWPATESFCSVLLADGRRLIAVARYGLTDQTRSHRRSGLELVGVLGPGDLDPASARTIYHWLRRRRAEVDDPRRLGGSHALEEVLATGVDPLTSPPLPLAGSGKGGEVAMPVLPIQLGQDGVFLFAALAPADPDAHLDLLHRVAVPRWQWLPLVGPDFPLQTYAHRGPLVAWTLNLPRVAVHLERHPGGGVARPFPWPRKVLAGLGGLVLVLLAANLWATLTLPARLPKSPPPSPGEEVRRAAPAPSRDGEREKFAQALYRLLSREAAPGEIKAGDRYYNQYKSLLAQDKDLYTETREGRVAVAALSVLARRRIDRIEALIRQALPSKKGFDPDLVEVVCRRVREHLAAGINKDSP
jgi:hypothetical protein